jgi:hypothetical protein
LRFTAIFRLGRLFLTPARMSQACFCFDFH